MSAFCRLRMPAKISWQRLAILEMSLPDSTSLPRLANSVDSVNPQRTGCYVRKKIECARMPGFGGLGGPGGVKAFLSVNGHWSLVKNTRDSKTARQMET